jgi:hypothetical protein
VCKKIMLVSSCVFMFAGCMFRTASGDQKIFNPKPATAQEAIEQVVMANRILSNEGIFDYLGHVSARNPENPSSFFISRALSPEEVTKADILEVALEGKVLTKSSFSA